MAVPLCHIWNAEACCEEGFGQGGLQKSLPTSIFLQVYEVTSTPNIHNYPADAKDTATSCRMPCQWHKNVFIILVPGHTAQHGLPFETWHCQAPGAAPQVSPARRPHGTQAFLPPGTSQLWAKPEAAAVARRCPKYTRGSGR